MDNVLIFGLFLLLFLLGEILLSGLVLLSGSLGFSSGLWFRRPFSLFPLTCRLGLDVGFLLCNLSFGLGVEVGFLQDIPWTANPSS